MEEFIYYIFKADRSTGGGVAPFKGQWSCKWKPDGKKLLLIVFLAVITPSASTITQMCQVYGNDSQYASAINVMTTLFSIVTMPLMVLFVPDDTLTKRKDQVLGIPGLFCIHMCIKGG